MKTAFRASPKPVRMVRTCSTMRKSVCRSCCPLWVTSQGVVKTQAAPAAGAAGSAATDATATATASNVVDALFA